MGNKLYTGQNSAALYSQLRDDLLDANTLGNEPRFLIQKYNEDGDVLALSSDEQSFCWRRCEQWKDRHMLMMIIKACGESIEANRCYIQSDNFPQHYLCRGLNGEVTKFPGWSNDFLLEFVISILQIFVNGRWVNAIPAEYNWSYLILRRSKLRVMFRNFRSGEYLSWNDGPLLHFVSSEQAATDIERSVFCLECVWGNMGSTPLFKMTNCDVARWQGILVPQPGVEQEAINREAQIQLIRPYVFEPPPGFLEPVVRPVREATDALTVAVDSVEEMLRNLINGAQDQLRLARNIPVVAIRQVSDELNNLIVRASASFREQVMQIQSELTGVRLQEFNERLLGSGNYIQESFSTLLNELVNRFVIAIRQVDEKLKNSMVEVNQELRETLRIFEMGLMALVTSAAMIVFLIRFG